MRETWLFIGLLVLGVVILFPVVMFILWALVSMAPKRYELCPSCGQRRLHLVRLLRGRLRGWGYFLCESCGARYKQPRGVGFEIASGEEWTLMVDPGTLFRPKAAKGESGGEPVTPPVKESTTTNLNPELRFPKPPFQIDPACENLWSQGDSVSSYLDQIRRWRLAVLAFIENSGEKPVREKSGLTERAQKELATFLASRWTPGMTDYATLSPYNFPVSALEGARNPTVQSLLEVLRWRAGVDNYLIDAIDFVTPWLDIDECDAIGKFLDPVGQEKLCHCCLTELAPEQRHSGEHVCMFTSHVQAKWPPTPPIFAKRAKEARIQESETGTDRLPPPAP